MTTLTIFSVKKFLIVDGEYWTEGGFGQYADMIARHFDRVVLCIHARRARREELIGYYQLSSRNITYRRLPWYENELQCMVKLPWMLLRSIWFARDSDIVNGRVPDYSGICGGIAARLMRKPVFYNIVGDWAEEASFTATRFSGLLRKCLSAYLWLYVWMEGLVIGNALAFVQGESTFKRYRNRPRKILVVSTSISERDIAHLRIPAGTPVSKKLLSVGRLQREKGHEYLLEAFAQLCREMSNIELLVVGVGNLRRTYEEWAQAKGLEGRIRFIGLIQHGDELFNIYRMADAFILPSVTEGTPKVLLEAMACGVPVVASKVGGVGTIIRHDVNGILVPPRDPVAIAAAILRLFKNDALREGIVNKGYRTARNHTNALEMAKIVDALRQEYPHCLS